MFNIKGPLAEVGWKPELDCHGKTLTHRINGEWCHWYKGVIEDRVWSAWIGTDSGTVYLHAGEDMGFEEFIELIKSGWPKPAAPQRGLFD